MLVIKIEMWPQGDESQAREIGRAHISNDGTGTPDRGHYDVKLLKSAEYATRPGTWKKGRVQNFPRQVLGPWDLLFRALRDCVADRNKPTLARAPEVQS